MSKNSHVVVNGKTSSIECLHCGAAELMRLPASITQVVEQATVFGKAHRKCKRRDMMKII